ncbi:uncharacterized protein LOC128989635 [Macrosteles quadrilineatus]|uniref:uncharacterized protein LOC128989635 n=1 Tax=Macrosteles quadrilineatus TaxID=74068 RepID=UPI0023E3330F|nr:uncharacterized protein LOC128989635 [Macrosteles quadrilineatus]
MVIMDYRDLLTEVSSFLRVTLAQEKLSEHAEMCRQQLITRLMIREGSPPQAYIDMNGKTSCQKLQTQISDCYEEFDNSFDSYKSQPQVNKSYVNNLYNILSKTNEENTYANDEDSRNCLTKNQSQEDNMYINPSSPLANTPVQKPSLPSRPTSNSNSERNSLISLKKDSDTSSFTSSSTRGEESAEVVSLSASALRYAASKCGVLGRREKFLFVDHTKQYWAAVVQQSMFMYSTDKDNKPIAVVDITGYQARPVATNNKIDFKFELVAPGKKTYQFVADKQSDMDKWIEAINVASKLEETRQLPSPPPAVTALETYDQPDSVIRPVSTEAEYELPETVLRSHNTLVTWRTVHRNSEPRLLPSLPQETYDSPDPKSRRVSEVRGRCVSETYESVQEELYHCIEDQQEPQKPKQALRRLPSLPLEATTQPTPLEEMYEMPESTLRPEEMYDMPDSKIRPEETYDMPESKIRPVIQDELYSVIDAQPVCQEAVYKNLKDNFCDREEDNNYYNLVTSYPEKEVDQECIYNVIAEQIPMLNNKTSEDQLMLDDNKTSEQRQMFDSKTFKQRPMLNKEDQHVLDKNTSEQRPKFITEQRPMLNNKITEQQNTTEQQQKLTSSDELKKPPISVKPILANSQTDTVKLKKGDKKLAPFVSSMATIFNKPNKPLLREVKPPVINKTCQ